MDASVIQVGDGSGNPVMAQTSADDTSESDSSDSSDKSDHRDLDGREIAKNLKPADWRKLGFIWHNLRGANVSYATSRGEHTTLKARWPDQGQLKQLFPDRYHAGHVPPATVQQGQGGITGELPVLVALVVFSVSPLRNLDEVLSGSMCANYRPHNHPHGEGCESSR
jgi:hypothetical protein